jgi:hypothetical protein
MKRMAILIVPVLLGGCVSEAEVKARQASIDDGKCQSYGSKPGEPAYVQCRAQLDAARSQAQATALAGMAATPAPAPWQPSPGVYSGMWHP